MISFKKFFSAAIRFKRNEKAGVGMLFGISIIPIMIFAGAAIDLSRAVRERAELYGATDSAVLAVGRIMKTATISEMAAVALKHLTASHLSPEYTFVANPTLNADKTEVCVTSRTYLQTTIMKLVNIHSIELHANSCAKIGSTTFEVAIALDNTGSMSGTKLSQMKTAAKSLVDQLLPANSTTYHAKVSLIPFNSAIKAFNPNAIAENGNNDEATRFNAITWMDVDGNSSIHWENFPKVVGGTFNPRNRFELFKNINTTWNGCFETRPGAFATSDAPASTTTADSLYVPMFAPDEGDNANDRKNSYIGDYGNSICANPDAYKVRDGLSPYFNDGQSKLCKYKPGVQVTTTPGACTTTQVCDQTKNLLRGIKKHASLDHGPMSRLPAGLPSIGSDINSLLRLIRNPNGSYHCHGRNNRNCHGRRNNDDDDDDDDDGPGGPTCQDVTTCLPDVVTTTPLTITADTSGGKGPNQRCDVRAVTQLSANPTALKTEIDAMTANGTTNLFNAMMWAWKTISPNSPYANYSVIKPYTEKNHEKVIVFMTDGDNVWSSTNNSNGSYYSPNGYFWNNRLGSVPSIGTVSSNNSRSFMDAKTLEACNSAKAAGVKVYTVGFSTGSGISAAGQALLQSCATSSSNYYLATNAAQLNAAFAAIGDDLTGLRISK